LANLSHIIPLLPGFIIGLTVHEFCHAWAANRLGDSTARDQGRMTLNPIAHLDLFGTLALVLAGFGWAKPVPVDASRLRSPRGDMALIAIAGPFSNLVLAVLIAFGLRAFAAFGGGSLLLSSTVAVQVIVQAVWINVVLAVFNLIPLPPLDGSRILAAVIPESWNRGYDQMERFGPMILIGLFVLAGAAGISVFSRIIMPVANPILRFLLGL